MKKSILVFNGKLGSETYIGSVDSSLFPDTPQHGSLIAFVDNNESNGISNVYTVLYPLYDYAEDELNLFVKPYDWEG